MEEIKTVEETEKRKKGAGERLEGCPDINIHARTHTQTRLSAFMHAARVQIVSCVHTCTYVLSTCSLLRGMQERCTAFLSPQQVTGSPVASYFEFHDVVF